MANVSAKEIAELRARTGAGIGDCKNALVEMGGDMDAAIELLRKKGIAKAEKRVGRAAAEGRIVSLTSPDGAHAVLVELNSETDFVSRNEDFGRLAEQLAEELMHDHATDSVVHKADEGSFLTLPSKVIAAGTAIGEVVKLAAGKTGENVSVRRYARFKTDGAIGSYVHHNGKVAVLVEVGGSTGAEAQQLARTVAEHVAAGVPTIPVSVNRDQVPAELVEKERRIFAEQARESGKPDNIVQKMVDGRIDKFYKEVTLLDQPWVREPEKTIAQLVAEAGKAAGATLSVRRFARFQMGEE